MEIFDELIDDNELDYGDDWRLNFNYSQTSCVSKEERKRGWKVYCNTAFGKYVCIKVGKVLGYLTLSNLISRLDGKLTLPFTPPPPFFLMLAFRKN